LVLPEIDVITLLSVTNFEQSRIEIFANKCIILSVCSDAVEIIYVKPISHKLLRTHQWHHDKEISSTTATSWLSNFSVLTLMDKLSSIQAFVKNVPVSIGHSVNSLGSFWPCSIHIHSLTGSPEHDYWWMMNDATEH